MRRDAASPAAQIPRARGLAVRHLHARHPVSPRALLERNPDRPRAKCATGSPATCAAAPAIDKIIGAVLDAAREMRGELTMSTMLEVPVDRKLQARRHAAAPARRRRQSDRPRAFGADHICPAADRQDLAQPARARAIKSIDTSKALALPGVKAVVTRDDFAEMPDEKAAVGELMMNFRDVTRNMMAREKALYDGHPVAAVAATSESIARRGAGADQGRIRSAAARDRRRRGDEAGRAAAARGPVHAGRQAEAGRMPSNVAKRLEFGHGRRRRGLHAGRRHRRARVQHQADASGLYRAAGLPCKLQRGRPGRDLVLAPRATSCVARLYAKCSASSSSKIRVHAGRNRRRLRRQDDDLSASRSRSRCRANRAMPVKMVMTREEVFRGTGPTLGPIVEVKIGAPRTGRSPRPRRS